MWGSVGGWESSITGMKNSAPGEARTHNPGMAQKLSYKYRALPIAPLGPGELQARDVNTLAAILIAGYADSLVKEIIDKRYISLKMERVRGAKKTQNSSEKKWNIVMPVFHTRVQ